MCHLLKREARAEAAGAEEEADTGVATKEAEATSPGVAAVVVSPETPTRAGPRATRRVVAMTEGKSQLAFFPLMNSTFIHKLKICTYFDKFLLLTLTQTLVVF